MKVPPKRKGNAPGSAHQLHLAFASMKVPPKRKGNQEIKFTIVKTAMPQ